MADTATRRRNGGAPQESGSTKSKAAARTTPRRRPASSKPKKGAAKSTAAKASGKTQPRPRPVAAARKTASKAAGKAKDVAEEVAPLPAKPNKLARKLVAKTIKKVAGRVLESGAEMIRQAVDRAAATGGEAVEKTVHKRLPIQRSVDVAVPLRVVWEEWMAFDVIPEGVHSVVDIERDGNELFGRTTGLHSLDWAAEVLDERERQSFAWQSHEGSDCAGLVTFHELSARLTRVELNLDVVPTSVPETVQLAMHLADRRAETELRRFKARLELINPDVYEKDEEEGDDAEPEQAGGDQPEDVDKNFEDEEQDDPTELDERDQAA